MLVAVGSRLSLLPTSTRRAHQQERQIGLIQFLVTVTPCWWQLEVDWVYSQPAHETATNMEWQLPEAVLVQFVSPDDEHDVLETCREL